MSGSQAQKDTTPGSSPNTLSLDALVLPKDETTPLGVLSGDIAPSQTISLEKLSSSTSNSHTNITTLAEQEPIQEAQQQIPITKLVTKKDTTSTPESTSEKTIEETLSLDTSKFTIDTPSITTTTPISAPTPQLMGDSRPTITKTPTVDHSKTILSISYITIVSSIIISTIVYSIQRYLTYASPYPIDLAHQATIDTIRYYEQEANNILLFNGYNDFASLPLHTSAGIQNLQSIIDASSINYIHKKDIIAEQFGNLSRQYINTLNDIDRLKTIIATHGGMDKSSYDLIKPTSSFSIQQSLSTVEIIKLSTALKTFYHLDSFINQFAAAIEIEPAIVKDQMGRMIARGEKDIKRYIESCYSNPYEQEGDCNNTKDFFNQYTILEPTLQLDPQFVIAILSYINQKLEQSTIPNLIINFSNFDPRSDSITLNIEINTFQEDELALISKGILNPHIFVVTNLINLLKQSTLIKDSGIDVKTLKITKKNIKVGSTEFTVNNSTFSFTVPIQESTSRDISDYAP